jgi:DNA polymerase I-like protein with 3'-5' exonuclease and polymerase domains
MINTCVFDIETDGLLNDLTTFHVGVGKHVGTGRHTVFRDPVEMTRYLDTFDRIVGHNAIRYDIPALSRLVGGWKPKAQVIDTLVLSRLAYPDRNTHPAGGSSLEKWGIHLGLPKIAHTDFTKYTKEMETYCMRDVDVTMCIMDRLNLVSMTTASSIEHAVAQVIANQYDNGFGFNLEAASLLQAELTCRSAELTEALQKAFPAKEIQLKTKVKTIPFNPGSRDQIASSLIKKHGWRPKEFTATGKPQIDESILKAMPYPEARLLEEYLLIEKRLSQLAQWIEHCKDGVVRGDVNTNGAVSGRMTHSDPNMAQVPRCGSPYGSECRALFRPTRKDWVMVGADASGLELRMFAHYLAMYDGGSYAEVVCNGDIHTHNQQMAGLKTRDQAKTFIYGLLYGAGDAKVGAIVDGTTSDGARLKASFKRQVPAYAKLLQALEFKVQKAGSLKGLDGRYLPVRSAHSALNLLLQSAGAVIMKMALIMLNDELSTKYPGRYAFMANIHDEWQIECHREIAEDVGNIAVDAIKKAGVEFDLKCPLKGEFKIGNNWAETH